MIEGEEISLEELEKDGWEHLDLFAGSAIMGKEDKRILFNPKKRKIELVYNT